MRGWGISVGKNALLINHTLDLQKQVVFPSFADLCRAKSLEKTCHLDYGKIPDSTVFSVCAS